MKIAIWHALLFFVTFYAEASGVLPPVVSNEGSTDGPPSFFNVVPLILVAAGTMAFRFTKPPGFAFKPGQAVTLLLTDPPPEPNESSPPAMMSPPPRSRT